MTISPKERIQTLTGHQPILLDGGIGSLLLASSGPGQKAPTTLVNITAPDLVLSAHVHYLRAGAEIILTNSFCASEPYLGKFGFRQRVNEINVSSVDLARKAIQQEGKLGVLVGGSIGPFPPATNTQAIESGIREQVAALISGGVDLLVFETFLDPAQITTAAQVCQAVLDRSLAKIPVVMSVVPSYGAPNESLIRSTVELRQQGLIDLIGVNCGDSFESSARWLEVLSSLSAGPFWLKPNAGVPSIERGSPIYPIDALEFASRTTELVNRFPIAAVGGCCGAMPEYIEALKCQLAARTTHRTIE
jgi:methionine synthase I (cobalamin-dependent)